jgi:hypothetical protein
MSHAGRDSQEGRGELLGIVLIVCAFYGLYKLVGWLLGFQ